MIHVHRLFLCLCIRNNQGRNSELSEDEHEGGNFKLDIQAFFKSSTVFNLLPRSGRVVVIDDRCSLMAAWTALALNDCAAAAVWSSAQNNFCGAFCVNDIVNIMCRHCTPASSPLSSSEAAPADDALVQCSALQSELLSNHMAAKGEPLDMSPADTIFNICSLMQARRCRFVPIIERDEEDGSCRAVQVWCGGDCAAAAAAAAAAAVDVYCYDDQVLGVVLRHHRSLPCVPAGQRNRFAGRHPSRPQHRNVHKVLLITPDSNANPVTYFPA